MSRCVAETTALPTGNQYSWHVTRSLRSVSLNENVPAPCCAFPLHLSLCLFMNAGRKRKHPSPASPLGAHTKPSTQLDRFLSVSCSSYLAISCLCALTGTFIYAFIQQSPCPLGILFVSRNIPSSKILQSECAVFLMSVQE